MPPTQQIVQLQDQHRDRDRREHDHGDKHAGRGDLAGDRRAGGVRVAQRAGEGVDGAVSKLGDQDQAGGQDQEAPTRRPDAQKRGRQGDQQAAIGVREEARIASEGMLQAVQSGGELRPGIATARAGGPRLGIAPLGEAGIDGVGAGGGPRNSPAGRVSGVTVGAAGVMPMSTPRAAEAVSRSPPTAMGSLRRARSASRMRSRRTSRTGCSG